MPFLLSLYEPVNDHLAGFIKDFDPEKSALRDVFLTADEDTETFVFTLIREEKSLYRRFVDEVREFLAHHDETIILQLKEPLVRRFLPRERTKAIEFPETPVNTHIAYPLAGAYAMREEKAPLESSPKSAHGFKPKHVYDDAEKPAETFQKMLLRKIDEKGLSDVEVYKKANLDRKLFSKIRCNEDYIPKKKTALALCAALELNLDETKDLLLRAGIALSPAFRQDRIFRYCIEHKIYDIFEINEILFYYGEPLLGI